LDTKDRQARKSYLSVLSDLIKDQKAVEEIRQIAWLDGISKLITCVEQEPVAVSLIFGALHRDPALRTQINAMMETNHINKII
jgi:hypothetical protein